MGLRAELLWQIQIQCSQDDLRTDEQCSNRGTITLSGKLSREAAIAKAKPLLVAEGWTGVTGKATCPSCNAAPHRRPPPTVEEAENVLRVARYESFMRLRASANEIARVLHSRNGSVIWSGSAKSRMATVYADRLHHGRAGHKPTIDEETMELLIKTFGQRPSKE